MVQGCHRSMPEQAYQKASRLCPGIQSLYGCTGTLAGTPGHHCSYNMLEDPFYVTTPRIRLHR